MKQKQRSSIFLGTFGGVSILAGAALCLLSQPALVPGLILAAVGIAAVLAMLLVRRRGGEKKALHSPKKALGSAALGTAGALTLAAGMCMTIVWDMLLLPGIVMSISGILLLVYLLPMYRSVQE